MPEPATVENWKDLAPVPDFQRPYGLDNLYVPNITGDHDLHYMTMREGLWARALWISPAQNMWCNVLKGKAGLINRHYHPTEIFAYTISGKWGYLEHEWTAQKGDFVYEPPGGSHTLVMYETDEENAVLFIQKMPLVWLDEQGNRTTQTDVYDILEKAEAHYAKTPLGKDYVRTLIR